MALRGALAVVLLAVSGLCLPTNEQTDGSTTLTPIPINDAPFLVQFTADCVTPWEGVILNETFVLSTDTTFRTYFGLESFFDYCDYGDVNQITVRVGSNTTSGGQVVKIAAVYEGNMTSNDADRWGLNIALFELESPLTFSGSISPVKLAAKPLSEPNTVKITSFGIKLASDNTIPYLLRSVDLSVYSKSKCENYFKTQRNETVSSNTFCVQEPHGPVSLLSSGAPVLNHNGELLGFKSDTEAGVNFFTDVTSGDARTFIEEVLAGNHDKVTNILYPPSSA